MLNLNQIKSKTFETDNSDSETSLIYTDNKEKTLVQNENDSSSVASSCYGNKEKTVQNENDSSSAASSCYGISDDENKNEENVTLRELILNAAQMCLYALDVFSDTFLAINYAVQTKYLYAFLTVAVVYIAAGIDAYFNRSELKREKHNYKYRYFFTLFLNIRGLDIYKNLVGMKLELYRGVNSIKETQEDFYDRNFRVANLKTHEGLFEACPQLLLQLYIMLVTIEENVNITLVLQIISVFISLCSLALTFITGDKARRLYEHECDNFSNWGLALQFFWIFPVTASRILALSCVTSVFPIAATACFSIHGFAAFMYLRLSEPYTSFGALVAAIRVFLTPYEPIEQYDDDVPSRLLRSHLIHFVGNVTSIALWAATTDLITRKFSIYVSILVFFVCGFAIGVTSLLVLLKYKQDCFIQDDEKESEMDKRMKPYVDFVKRCYTRIRKRFHSLYIKCKYK